LIQINEGELKMLGETLRSLRKQKRFTSTELARQSGVSRSAIWKVEKNICAPSISTLQALASVLEEDISVFFAK
jgi:transcriptional regulator with XRE-family HTH domain